MLKSPFAEVDLIIEVLRPFRSEIKSILEIGCGNGMKLERLAEFFYAAAEGIDLSNEAIRDGTRRVQQSGKSAVHLVVGSADTLPYLDLQFDYVHFGFSLYVTARQRLLRSIAEADRVLRAGGFLSIIDFDPPVMHKKSYHHKAGVFSYKNQYDEFFTVGGRYHLVLKTSFTHGGQKAFSKDGNERVALSVLYKEPDPYPTW